jgi:plasmid rolling circle replication initiator protein Rep
MIAKCTCVHEYQDKLHGKNNRVCNVTFKKNLRCTVCSKEQTMKETLNPTSKPEKKKK